MQENMDFIHIKMNILPYFGVIFAAKFIYK